MFTLWSLFLSLSLSLSLSLCMYVCMFLISIFIIYDLYIFNFHFLFLLFIPFDTKEISVDVYLPLHVHIYIHTHVHTHARARTRTHTRTHVAKQSTWHEFFCSGHTNYKWFQTGLFFVLVSLFFVALLIWHCFWRHCYVVTVLLALFCCSVNCYSSLLFFQSSEIALEINASE